MPRCIIESCTSVYEGSKGRNHLFFNPPKDPNSLSLWQKAINRKHFVVRPHHVVCAKHFRKEDILWRNEIKDQFGVVVGVSPYKIPKLKKGVLPTLHIKSTEDTLHEISTKLAGSSPLEHYYMKENEEVKEPNSPTENLVIMVKPEIEDLTYEQYEQEESTKTDEYSNLGDPKTENICEPLSPRSIFDDILRSDDLEIPPSWIKYTILNDGEPIIVFSENICRPAENGLKTLTLKEIIVDELLCVHINVLNERVKENDFLGVNRINNMNDLQHVINMVSGMNICQGYCTSKSIDYQAVYVDPLKTYRHVNCSLLVNESRCRFCYE